MVKSNATTQEPDKDSLIIELLLKTNEQSELITKLLQRAEDPNKRKTEMKRVAEVQQRRSRELSIRIGNAERDLAIGEKHFRIVNMYRSSTSQQSVPQPEMTMERLVGAADQANAEKKYLRHFGIIMPGSPLRVEEIDELPPLDSWPEFQARHVRSADVDAEAMNRAAAATAA